MNFFYVILIDRASVVSATRSRTLEPMVMDLNPLVFLGILKDYSIPNVEDKMESFQFLNVG
jgi:hypothetical protein